ncbi:Fmo1p [Sugiyamaella lignohabitans]|uniref:Fmo1p n=1 Tax=Sugiyamaella lignohabitans TaxID=796027 RepID=A0A167FA86_9ASCO|nr:Fmo1p [Sugiyamaella lignohabitans]ANB15025.1 Fmo1p [Sugiyamaella lignohabitans]
MEYKEFPFPNQTPMFPTWYRVLEYVQSYSRTFLEGNDTVHVSLETLVKDVRKDPSSGQWTMITSNVKNTSIEDEYIFDAVVVCSGHYAVAQVPSVEGLDVWAKNDPDSISHAKYFDDPQAFRGKNVLVVGNAASGIDISVQLLGYANQPIYRSVRSPTSSQLQTKKIKEVAQVAKYDFLTRSAVLEDGSIVKDIDHILFCTGYLYSFPYLKSYSYGENAIITDGSRVHHLFKQMFYIHDPSLIFVGMQWKIIPMPMAESQGMVIARVLSGRLDLPSKSEMAKHEANEIKLKGDDRRFHCFQYPQDYEYTKQLHDWAQAARNSKHGFMAELWNKEKQELRSRSSELKNEYFKKTIEQHEKV